MAKSVEGSAQATHENRSEMLDYLMRRFGGQVIKLAYYHVRDRQLSEDIMQEVFLRVYRNYDRFRQDSSYYTWIYRITVNLCNDYLKSAYFRRIRLGHPDGTSVAGSDAPLFEAVEGGEVFRAVMDLPPKYRMALALHYFEDMSTRDIANVLNLSENAVRTRLHRGRSMLKEKLEVLSYERP